MYTIGERATKFKVGDYLSNSGPNIPYNPKITVFQVDSFDLDMQLHMKVVATDPNGLFAYELQSGRLIKIRPERVILYQATPHNRPSLEEGYDRL